MTAGQFGAQFVHEISPWCGVVVNWVLVLELEILFLIKPNDVWLHLLSFCYVDIKFLFLNCLIPLYPIPNSNAWVHHHPWWSFCQFQVWFDPIWCPISKYEQNSLIIFNLWTISLDPIQFLIPIHGYNIHEEHFFDMWSDMTKYNT